LLEFLEQEILLKHAALRAKHETMIQVGAGKRKINELVLIITTVISYDVMYLAGIKYRCCSTWKYTRELKETMLVWLSR